MYLEVGAQRIRHHPQPTPVTTRQPRGLVNVIDQGGTHHVANGRVVGKDRFGDTIDPLLDRPLAQRYPDTEAHRSCTALRLAPTIPAISPTKPVSSGP